MKYTDSKSDTTFTDLTLDKMPAAFQAQLAPSQSFLISIIKHCSTQHVVAISDTLVNGD